MISYHIEGFQGKNFTVKVFSGTSFIWPYPKNRVTRHVLVSQPWKVILRTYSLTILRRFGRVIYFQQGWSTLLVIFTNTLISNVQQCLMWCVKVDKCCKNWVRDFICHFERWMFKLTHISCSASDPQISLPPIIIRGYMEINKRMLKIQCYTFFWATL